MIWKAWKCGQRWRQDAMGRRTRERRMALALGMDFEDTLSRVLTGFPWLLWPK